MLKASDHQVAGHEATDGKLGPVVDESGRFYKPLQSGERGLKEVAFYEALRSNKTFPDHIRSFFPIYYGTKHLEVSNGSGMHPHLILQDLNSTQVNPSIMDIKMGCRTWPPESSEDYVQKCLQKDRGSTSLPIGFRISGLEVFGSKESGLWKPDKKYIQSLSVDDVRLVLRKFVSSNASADLSVHPDCSLASVVYDGPNGILAQLLELKAWFEEQTLFHFYSCSILFMYEKGSGLEGQNCKAKVKLIDFAHVLDGCGVIDHNFLGGLCSLINFIKGIIVPPNA
ncbi:Inositol polyphosphate multikinase [Heracleum sosnowskyi]|uniref:Inositol polyphosphate multikinase n=1 Tax=Heracleum sosnowskyi TaxID=360622 RepID=A0AAD8H077_9APIA|nr:Inositol polyphosphate multikinase [Heracleum sosnowskyi]